MFVEKPNMRPTSTGKGWRVPSRYVALIATREGLREQIAEAAAAEAQEADEAAAWQDRSKGNARAQARVESRQVRLAKMACGVLEPKPRGYEHDADPYAAGTHRHASDDNGCGDRPTAFDGQPELHDPYTYVSTVSQAEFEAQQAKRRQDHEIVRITRSSGGYISSKKLSKKH